MPFSVLTMVNGPDYDDSVPRRRQPGWDEHAAFMDGLVDEGFVVLGGPIGDGTQVMLVVEAADEPGIRARFAGDPWGPMGILRIGAIQPWTIWLDGRKSRLPGDARDHDQGAARGAQPCGLHASGRANVVDRRRD